MNTVSHIELHNIWDGKVIVDEIKQFADNRGMVSEIYRQDDTKTIDSSDPNNIIAPKMAYWSITNPLIMRGNHQHANQTDFFVSWFNRMVYQLFNPDTKEFFHFITEPNKVYRVKVAPPIIHSYRNLDFKPSTTGNFPTSLFMGENKTSPIDEVRLEHITEHKHTYVVLGANGRLGKSCVKKLYEKIGYFKYNVIPVYEKIKNINDLNNVIDTISKVVYEDVTIINCIGLLNLPKTHDSIKDMPWVNSELPNKISEECAHRSWKFIHFSSDYVLQSNNVTDDTPAYTKSKILAETYIKNNSQNISTTIIRVANLFSENITDNDNLIVKFINRIKNNEVINIDKNIHISPTNVEDIADVLVENMLKNQKEFTYKDGLKIINIIPPKYYTLKYFLTNIYNYSNFIEIESDKVSWHTEFFNKFPNFYTKDPIESIKRIINIRK